MIRKAVLGVILLLGLAGPLWAMTILTVEGDFMMGRQYTGVALAATDGVVIFTQGLQVAGEVFNPTTLASHGLKDLKEGEAIEATYLGGQKVRLLHVESGRSVEIMFPRDYFKQKKGESEK